jgi:hypothetical protein
MKPRFVKRSDVTDFRMCGIPGCNGLAVYQITFIDGGGREGPWHLFCGRHYDEFMLTAGVEILKP